MVTLTKLHDHGIMTMVMQTISKSQFKSQALHFLRLIEKSKQPLILTHNGKPVAKVIPYQEDPEAILKSLQGTVLHYEDPTEPVGLEDWEVLK